MNDVEYVSANKRFKVTFNAGAGEKDVFKQISRFQEVFELNNVCGNCKGTDIYLRTRTIDSDDYYEKVCNKCGYSFSYGQHRTGGTLFPKYSKGWTKFEKLEDKEEVEETPVKTTRRSKK